MTDFPRKSNRLEKSSGNQPFETVSGCIVAEKIHESPHTLVYRGRRRRDDLPVILKILNSEYPTSGERLAFQKEYEMTQTLEMEGVIGVYGLEKHMNTFAMLLEDFGASSLDFLIPKGILSIKEILKTATEMAAILGRIHAAGIIHKGINPSNILYNRETGSVKIIDFGSATQLPRENPAVISPYALGKGLAYISPEQTGRMERHLDWRTDLYSLGVTLYEMLTKKLPFDTHDAMDLVYCHMAKEPRPPHAIDSRIPEMVSKMVMKLMAKAPEDRYQSAPGIQSDLERCLQQLGETSGIINLFPLASHDISDRFQIPQKLYGREREVGILMEAFEGVGRGGCELMLISGAAGIGKTALVQKIHGPITQNRGYFISGKFDQYQRNVPYSGMIRAFQDLVRQLLTENEVSLAGWREKLLTALSPNAQVMIDVIPELELITGPAKESPDLPPAEAENRFNLVLQDYITVFAGQGHPLTMFLDDLQWIDHASLKIVKRLTTSPKSRHFLMVGAYRDNEVPDGHALKVALEEARKDGAVINRIPLSPLGSHEITLWLGETLKRETKAVRSLAEAVSAKTGGNPFSISAFLKSLYEENLISFDYAQRQWKWSIQGIQEKQVVDNVVDLLVGKMHRFEAHTRNALMTAACLGNQFELETLAMATERSPRDTAESLGEAISEGLVIETRTLKRDVSPLEETEDFSAYQYRYRFSHDRFQQAAYAAHSRWRQKCLALQNWVVGARSTLCGSARRKTF